MVAMPHDKVRKPAVEFVSLGDLSQLHQLGEVVDLCSDCKVVVGELVGSHLQILASACNISRDLAVLSLKGIELVAELLSFASSLNFDLTCESFELINIARTNLLLDCQKLKVELVLIRFLQECNEECACFED